MDKVDYSSQKKFIIDILSYLPAKIIPILISFLWSYIFTRIFSPEEYGLYGLVLSVTLTAISVLTEWIGQPVGRFYSDYFERKELHLYNYAIKTSIKVQTYLIIIASIISLGYTAIFVPENTMLVFTAIVNIVLNSFYSLLLPMIPASLNTKLYRILEIGRPAIRLVIALLIVVSIEKNILALIWAESISNLFFLLLMMKPIQKLLFTDLKTDVADLSKGKETFIKFLKFGIPMAIWFFCSQFISLGSRFVIEIYRDSFEVGLYTANFQLINGISGLISAPITLAAFPLIMKLWALNEKDKIVPTLENMTRIYGIIGIGIIGGTALIAYELVKIALDPQYIDGYKIMLPLVMGFVLWNASILGHKGMELMESTMTMVIAITITAIVNVILNFIFVGKFGYVASAWVTFASYFIYTAIIYFKSERFIKWRIPKILIVYTFYMLIVVLLLKYLFTIFTIHSVIMSLIIKGSIFSILYFGPVVYYDLKLKNKKVKISANR